jgi:hypothetical protein
LVTEETERQTFVITAAPVVVVVVDVMAAVEQEVTVGPEAVHTEAEAVEPDRA